MNMYLITFFLLSIINCRTSMSQNSSHDCNNDKDESGNHRDSTFLEIMKLYISQQTDTKFRDDVAALKNEVNKMKSCNKQGKFLTESGECSRLENPTLEVKWVTFNAKTMEVYDKKGVSAVRPHQYGFQIVWSRPFSNRNYAITGSANMLNTDGVMFDVEGNNKQGDRYNNIKEASCVVGTRDPRRNAISKSDYISVVAIGN